MNPDFEPIEKEEYEEYEKFLDGYGDLDKEENRF